MVRLIDTGTFEVRRSTKALNLSWITIEYVHGGVQGATLRQGVQGTIQATGHAFDPARATRAIECIASGLSAVHDVGVVHRQLTPESILCCGSGDDELFKISDFGMARPRGIRETIMAGRRVGNAGVSPPEMLSADPSTIRPVDRHFNLASVIFFLLTGEGVHHRGVAGAGAHGRHGAHAPEHRRDAVAPPGAARQPPGVQVESTSRSAGRSTGEAQERLQEAAGRGRDALAVPPPRARRSPRWSSGSGRVQESARAPRRRSVR